MELQEIKRIIFEETGVSEEDLKSDNKTNEYVIARHIYTHFAIKYSISFNCVAKSINKHVETVRKSEKQFDDRLKYDRAFKLIFDKVNNRISCSKLV